MYSKLSFVVPAYNEERTLESIITKVVECDLGEIAKEILIVDDGSKDRTYEIATKLANRYVDVKVLQNPVNVGKSQTVKHGLMETTGDLVVIQDADHEYDPADLKKFVETFQSEDVDLIYGNRFGKNNKVIYWQNWIGNRALSLFSSLFTWVSGRMITTDMEVCYKMAKGEIFRDIAATIRSTSNFGVEPELTAKFAKYRINGRRLNFKQIPISYYPRTKAEGKKITVIKDGSKALKEIIFFNLFG